MPIYPRLYRSLYPRIRRLLGIQLRVAIPLCAVSLILASCWIFRDEDDLDDVPVACVQTHDQGCVLEPEFEALVEEIAGEYAEQSGFQNQWGLEAIGADEAYANVELQFGPDTAPGEGVIVGILDTGVDGEDPAFRDKTVIERLLTDATDEDGSEFSHGTAVASVIAGEDIPGYEFDAQGVAWGADLVVFAIPLGEPPELYDPIKLSELPGVGEYFAETFEEVFAWRFGSQSIDFLNLSLGVSGIIETAYAHGSGRESLPPDVEVEVRAGERVECSPYVPADGATT